MCYNVLKTVVFIFKSKNFCQYPLFMFLFVCLHLQVTFIEKPHSKISILGFVNQYLLLQTGHATLGLQSFC